MATTESAISAPASSSDVGRHLRAVRKSKGLSRAEVARSAGLTKRELAAYERGRSPVPDSDLWCLAGSCGVDVGDLLPTQHRLGVSSDLGALTVGQSVARLRPTSGGGDDVLREYIAMVYELRNLPPGTKPPLRDDDLARLADALGGTPDAIEVRLHELIGASRDEAARLRSMILPPRPIAAPPPPAAYPDPSRLVSAMAMAQPVPAGVPAGPAASFVMPPPPMTAPLSAAAAPPPPTALGNPEPGLPTYPAPAFDFASPAPSIGDPAATDRFFAAPHADDPFAPPPPLGALVDLFDDDPPPLPGWFAPPTTSPLDPFAPPSGPPLVAASTARPDGLVADMGRDDDPAVPDAFTAFADPFADPFEDAYAGTDIVDVGDVVDVGDADDADDADLEGSSDDDPFAVLRVPIDDTRDLGSFADAEDLTDADDAALAAPLLSADDDPTDDWFDRAAAAADALIAEQRHDGPIVLDPGPTVVDATDPAPIAWSLAPVVAPAPGPHADPDPVPAAESPADPGSPFVAAGTDWQVGGIFPATAMADDGALALRRADVRWALADLEAEGDFTLRATVGFTSGAGFGLLFRVSTDDSERITGYSFDIDPIYSGGGFLIRQWNDSRQHWKPLAHAPVADNARLYGSHVIEMSLRNDMLVATIDDETVMTIPQLSRCSIDAGHEPCRGGRLGVQAWSTTEVTVDRLLVARH